MRKEYIEKELNDSIFWDNDWKNSSLKEAIKFCDLDSLRQYFLPFTKKYFKRKGFRKFFYEKFEIPVSLPRPPNGSRGTYTVKTEISARTQFSGPVYLPWYFVLAKKR